MTGSALLVVLTRRAERQLEDPLVWWKVQTPERQPRHPDACGGALRRMRPT